MTELTNQIAEIMDTFDCSLNIAERIQKLIMYTTGYKTYTNNYFKQWHNANLNTMEIMDKLLGTYGVERIQGKNTSPSFYYLNNGETYKPTLCYIPSDNHFPFVINAWGDIVENGDY